MDDMLFFRLQKNFPGVLKTDVEKLMNRCRVTQHTVMDWASKGLLGVGNNGLEKVGEVSKTSVDVTAL